MNLRGIKIGTLLGVGMALIIGVMVSTTFLSNYLSGNAQDIIQTSSSGIFDALTLQRDTDEIFSLMNDLVVVMEIGNLVSEEERLRSLIRRAEATLQESREKEVFDEEGYMRAERVVREAADASARIFDLKKYSIEQGIERGGIFRTGFSDEAREMNDQYNKLRRLQLEMSGIVTNVIFHSDEEFRSAMMLVGWSKFVGWVVVGISLVFSLVMAYFLVRSAKKIFDLKNEFINIIAHDLRNPVTAILGYLDIIMTNDKLKIADIKKQLKIVEVAGHRLRTQINNLLEVGRTEAGYVKVNLESVAVVALLNESVIRAKAFADTKGITIKYDESIGGDVYVLADRHKFTDVLDNLISNAVKYNRKEGLVTITTSDEGEMFTISVTDTGYGIPDNQRDKIFKKYTRLESSSKERVGGTGLGLYTAKLAMDQMKGAIAFTTKKNKGTTFTVSFRKVRKDGSRPESSG
jgi:signal transduction histidine kinase